MCRVQGTRWERASCRWSPRQDVFHLVGGVGLGWIGLAASCGSMPSGVGFLPCPTTRLNYLTVRLQGRADYRQPPNHTEAQVGGRSVCRRAGEQGCGRGLGLARGGQVWPGAPALVRRPWEPDAEPTRESWARASHPPGHRETGCPPFPHQAANCQLGAPHCLIPSHF